MARPLLAATAILLAACESMPLDPPAPPSARRVDPAAATLLSAGGRAFTFTTIEVPGARATTAWGINARGDIVGSYVDANGASHGFLLQGGVFTTIDQPGADGSQARGIGPNGEIVGIYSNDEEPAVNAHGFLRTPDGEFLAADYPGHINTIPQRLLPDGTILGCRHDTDLMASMRGIALSRHGASEIDAFASMHNGATPDLRRIAGLYTNMTVTPTRTEGYIIDDGVFTAFLVPGSSMTAAWDVSPSGDVVGVYRDGTGFHGFLLSAEGYLPIDVPGATATRAFGTNARGDVVGAYVAGGRTFGFVGRRGP
ncbi:MAG TPA: hypothetical protein VNI61_10840 [Gemmatimonadales bacterium]|nr:hypothetical protein [Gemmatimonadales bacterium]